MTKSTITREESIQAVFDLKVGYRLGFADIESLKRVARMALAAMDSEPVIVVGDDGGDALSYRRLIQSFEPGTKLYRHAQPAPVVPKEMTAGIAVKHWEGGRGSIESFVAGYNFCRATMLQASPVCTCPSGDGSLRWPCPVHPGNSPVIPDGWTGNDKANAALMMLDRIETADPVDDDRIDGIKRIVRELAAAPHDTPALNSVQSVVTVPGKWIPVSERMPEEGGRYWCYVEEQNSLGKSHYQWNCSWNGDVWSDKALTGRVTHWMPPPCAPREVK
ncbi:DUF551 domain-containing protein [Klebsiella pneumoniae]|nr:DUF551 domain-containing protein [Klebsiella pneumoniae]